MYFILPVSDGWTAHLTTAFFGIGFMVFASSLLVFDCLHFHFINTEGAFVC